MVPHLAINFFRPTHIFLAPFELFGWKFGNLATLDIPCGSEIIIGDLKDTNHRSFLKYSNNRNYLSKFLHFKYVFKVFFFPKYVVQSIKTIFV